eukprot:GEMP01034041.1.p1 GENE.GEMP01034041.1~~GEMP01034041.1.p1  ORF type:complete len:323 (+),score=20.49 GEMP01034041.1:110-970(+)
MYAGDTSGKTFTPIYAPPRNDCAFLKNRTYEQFYRTNYAVDPQHIEGCSAAVRVRKSRPPRTAPRPVQIAALDAVENPEEKHHRARQAPYGSIYRDRQLTPGPGYYEEAPRSRPIVALLTTGTAKTGRVIKSVLGPGQYDIRERLHETGKWCPPRDSGRPDCEPNAGLPLYCASRPAARWAISRQRPVPKPDSSVLDCWKPKSDFQEGVSSKSTGFSTYLSHDLDRYFIQVDHGPSNSGREMSFLSEASAERVLEQVLRTPRLEAQNGLHVKAKPRGFTFSKAPRM